ncbi:MAG: HEAT repeat domain-containing protein [Candidatus Poribacteria bacterium]|nr:HEAT repeat domain-containing protein [Candidatus Poribacteria bacterium]
MPKHGIPKQRKMRGMNKYQKNAHRRGEDRLRGDEVEYYLSLAYSSNPDDRVEAMDNLCPCHVRKSIDKVWVALYKGLVDPDLRVRKAAWHTLDDGGNPNDPRLQPLLERITKEETDPKLRQRALDLIAATRKVEEQKEVLLGQKAHTFRGRCDWCGESNVPVSYDHETELETNGTKRFALVCEACETE